MAGIGPVPCGGAAGRGGGAGVGVGVGAEGGGAGLQTGADQLTSLNNDASLDAEIALNSYIADDENISQFFQTHIKSNYYDLESFIDAFKNSHEPLLLSLNIQSLNSKYEPLKAFICEMQLAEIPLDIVILQETWELKFPNLLTIPGFQKIAYRTRDKGRGGGCGYICSGWFEFQGTSRS